MKRLATFFFFGLSVFAETTKPIDPRPADPITAVMGVKKPVVVRVARNQATLLILPPGQRIMNVFGADKGDGGLWSVDPGKVPQRYVAVKPRDTGIHTTIHVVSNTAEEISFDLEEVTGKDTQFDSEVNIESNHPVDNSAATATPEVKWVPADEVASCSAQAASATKAAEEATKSAQSKIDAAIVDFKSKYPGTLQFDYRWDDLSKAQRLGLRAIWHDDKFTYIRGDRVLALYEINEDGKPSLIQYKYDGGVYYVSKLVDEGYLAIGTKKENTVHFSRERSR